VVLRRFRSRFLTDNRLGPKRGAAQSTDQKDPCFEKPAREATDSFTYGSHDHRFPLDPEDYYEGIIQLNDKMQGENEALLGIDEHALLLKEFCKY